TRKAAEAPRGRVSHACSEPPQHDADHCEANECYDGCGFVTGTVSACSRAGAPHHAGYAPERWTLGVAGRRALRCPAQGAYLTVIFASRMTRLYSSNCRCM